MKEPQEPPDPPHTIHFAGPHFLYLPWAPPILSAALRCGMGDVKACHENTWHCIRIFMPCITHGNFFYLRQALHDENSLNIADTRHAFAIQQGSSATVMCCRGALNIGQTLNSCLAARTKERRDP